MLERLRLRSRRRRTMSAMKEEKRKNGKKEVSFEFEVCLGLESGFNFLKWGCTRSHFYNRAAIVM